MAETVKHTPKQAQIIAYLRICSCPASPTEIGVAAGKEYGAASSWALGGLKPLVKRGEVLRYVGGFYDLPAPSQTQPE